MPSYLVVLSLLVAGCSETPEFVLPWPQGIQALADCVPYEGGFTEPTVEEPAGDVRMFFSSHMEPIGVAVPVAIEVFLPGTDALDEEAQGAITLDIGDTGEVLEQSSVVNGRAHAVIRFDRVGTHPVGVTATLAQDMRVGTREIVAFSSQLPIWEIAVVETDFERILDDPGQRIKIPVDLVIDGDAYTGEMRLHGGSSRFYPKKSFRIDLDNGPTKDGERHLIVRAEYADKSLLRNWLGYELFRNGTWLPTPRSELIHLRLNGAYYGVMNHVERIDSEFLTQRGMSATGSLYEADPPTELSVPGGSLEPLQFLDDYRQIYPWHQGTSMYEDLIDLIARVLQSPNSSFKKNFSQSVVVEDYLVYLSMMAVIQNHDHVRKNYYLFSDTHGMEDRWRFIPWDLDLTLGHLWDEENDVLDERIVVDADPFVGERSPERFGFYNHMIDRTLKTSSYRREFVAMMSRIVEKTFTEEFVNARIDNALCLATPDILADGNKRATNAEFLDRVDEIRDFVTARRNVIRRVAATE